MSGLICFFLFRLSSDHETGDFLLESVHKMSMSSKTHRIHPLYFPQRLLCGQQNIQIPSMSSSRMWLQILSLQVLSKSLQGVSWWGSRALRKMFILPFAFYSDFSVKNDRAISVWHRIVTSISRDSISNVFCLSIPDDGASSFDVSIVWCVSMWFYVEWVQLVRFGQDQ